MRFHTLHSLVALAALLASLHGIAPAAAQEVTRSVTGRVTSSDTGAPVPAAQVFLVGTNRGTLTDTEGRYRLTGLLEDSAELRVVSVGYSASTVTLAAADGPQVLDFVLDPVIYSLDEIAVTVVGQQRRRELGHVVGSIDAAKVVETEPVATMNELLTARVPGVNVTTGGGGVGSASRIRIRGSNSISLSNEPIVYVDGVRIDSETFGTIFTGGQDVSRLDDLNPDDIASIEIAKGPSAATLYGTDAASGVILIKTHRGVPGATRWNAHVELASTRDAFTYPAAYSGIDEDHPSGFLRRNCALVFVANGACTQDRVESFNVLEDPSQDPFQTGLRQQYGLGVSGGSEQFQYHVSGEWETENGAWQMPDMVVDSLRTAGESVTSDQIRPNGLDRLSLRANLNAALSRDADLAISSSFTSSGLRRTQNDEGQRGIYWGGLLGESDPEVRRGWGVPGPAESMRFNIYQDIDRFTSGASANWRPLSFLSARASVGIDYVWVHDHLTDFIFNPQGRRVSNRSQLSKTTAELGLGAEFDLTGRTTSRTSVGFQYFSDLSEMNFAVGENMPFGCESIGCATTSESDEVRRESVTVGFFLDQQFSIDDRLFFTAGARVDDNSAFGRDFDLAVYPKLQASWVISDESFFPIDGLADDLRLRAAWGASGRQPGTLENVQFYFPASATIPVGQGFQDVAAVTFGELGNPALKPERSHELELGIDARLLDSRLAAEFTYYRKRTEDALVNRSLPPSLGLSFNRFENIGLVRNDGFELGLTGVLVDTRDWSWDLSVMASTNENELLELGEQALDLDDGFRVGYPLGGIWEPRLLGWEDTNGDGILVVDEVMVSDTAEFLGTPYANQQATVSTSVQWQDRIRVGATLDVRDGGIQGDGTAFFRCANFVCSDMFDPAAPLERQAKVVAALFHPAATEGAYWEGGAFGKLREVSVTFFFPESWTTGIRANRASLSVAARNVATWSAYPGFDPEINWDGGGNFGSIEFLTQPPMRVFSFRLNVTF